MAEYEKKVREVLSKYGCYFLRHGKGNRQVSITTFNFIPDEPLKVFPGCLQRSPVHQP
jgi:hypothetical protein